MTLQEFKARHADVVLDELEWDDLDALASGAALFYVLLSNKDCRKEDKAILYAGHAMTIGMCNDGRELLFVRTTAKGNVRLDSVTRHELQNEGRTALFRTMPIPKDDPRSRKPWNQWR